MVRAIILPDAQRRAMLPRRRTLLRFMMMLLFARLPLADMLLMPIHIRDGC